MSLHSCQVGQPLRLASSLPKWSVKSGQGHTSLCEGEDADSLHFLMVSPCEGEAADLGPPPPASRAPPPERGRMLTASTS